MRAGIALGLVICVAGCDALLGLDPRRLAPRQDGGEPASGSLEASAPSDDSSTPVAPGQGDDSSGASDVPDATVASDDGPSTASGDDAVVGPGDTGADAPRCTNQCTSNLTRCAAGGGAVQTCELQGPCNAWVTTKTCGANELCPDRITGAVSCGCSAASSCTGAGSICVFGPAVATCELDSEGCWYQSSTTPCAKGQTCASRAPAAACATPAAKVYFTRTTNPSVWSMNPDASSPLRLASLPSQPGGIAVDGPASKMFVTLDGGTISTASLTGTGLTPVLTGLAAHAGPIALDVGGGKMYFANGSSLSRASLNGANLQNLASATVAGVAVDPAKGYLFWADVATSAIWRSALDGTGAKSIVNQMDLAGLGVDPVGQSLLWGEYAGDLVHRSAYDGTGSVAISQSLGPIIQSLAVDPAGARFYLSDDSTCLVGGNVDGTFGAGTILQYVLAADGGYDFFEDVSGVAVPVGP